MIFEIVSFALLPGSFLGAIFVVSDGIYDYSETAGFTVAKPAVEGQAMATSDAGNLGVIAAGLSDRKIARLVFERPEARAAMLAEIGRADTLLLNRAAADGLRVGEGDTLTLLVVNGDVTPMGVVPRTKRYRVAGVVAYRDYASSMPVVFLDTEEARTLLGIDW